MATRAASSMFDQQALVGVLAQASAKQSAHVRQAVFDATLRALQGREMTIQNIRSALKSVTNATNAGALQSALPKADVESMLQSAVAGMDDALLRAVDAHRLAVGKMVEQGVGAQDQVLQKAVETVEKMEDALFKAIGQAIHQGASGAGTSPLAKPWGAVLEKMQAGGTGTGAQATQMLEQFTTQAQATLKQSRAASVQAATLFAQSWGALVSGVLMGMSDAMKQQGGAAPKAKK